MRMTNPLELFSFLSDKASGEGPQDIRFFQDEEFLFASFNDGKEQIVHINALSPAKLSAYWEEVRTNFSIPGAE